MTRRLLICAPYAAPHVGGVEAYVEDLLHALAARGGVETLVLAPRLPADAPVREQHASGAWIRRYPAVEPVANFPVPRPSRELARALRAASTFRPDVVVSHTRFFVASLLAPPLARAAGARWVHTEHGSDHPQLDARGPAAVARGYDRTLGRAVLRGADAVIGISAACSAFAREIAGVEAVTVHRGVDLAAFEAVPASGLPREHAAGRVALGFVGRLIDGKGVADLLAALPADAALLVVGDGPRRAELEADAAARGLDGRVRFLGQRTPEEALAITKGCDVLVNPSYTEGLPTAVLQAACAGVAVVATDVGGTAEVLDDGRAGVLVAPRDPAGLRDALERLTGDRAERDRLAAAARAFARERFSWAPTLEHLLGRR